MYKFFVDSNQIVEDKIVIKGSDVNHIRNVLRLKKDDLVYVGNKDTHMNYLCAIKDIKEETINCAIKEKLEETTEAKTYIHIFQGLPKLDKMEYIIEKCTEIGVKEITPVIMDRTIVKLDESAKDKKLSRWIKIAEVAAKQSKRDEILIINNIINFKDIFENVMNYDILFLAYEEEHKNTLKNFLRSLKTKKDDLKIAIIIGPEGGISQKEAEVCLKNNFKSVTLGKRILRTETAPLVISSNILYELEENQ